MTPLSVAVTLEQCWHEVPGGTATSALDLVAGLRHRPDIDVIGVAARHGEPPPAPWAPTVPVKHHKLPRAALYESWHRTARPLVEDLTGPVDVVHATGVAVPGTNAALVVTVHDLAFEHYPQHPTKWGLRFFRRAMVCARDRADAIICPSHATAMDCVAHGFDPARLHVVPWGIDWPVVEPTVADEARVRLGVPERYVLWVGTIEPRKNLTALLAAFAAVDDGDLHLVLAGPPGWGDTPKPPDAIAARVHFTGFLAPNDLRALYRSAIATCYPSLLEGFGLPVLESMSQGTPVITTKGTATEEVLGSGDAAGGLAVEIGNDDALAGAIAAVVHDETLRDRLSAAALTQAAAFTPDRTAEETIAVYRTVVS